MANTRTTPASRASSASPPSRLPSARERRPALAALAVLLIVGGAFASGWLALQAGNREEYLVLTEDVSAGEEISDGNTDTVDLPENVDGLVPADQSELAIGKLASIPLLAGTILTTNMVSEEDDFLSGDQKLVALAVDASALPQDLDEGEIVSVATWSGEENIGLGETFYAIAGSLVRPDEEGGVTSDETVTLNLLMDSSCHVPILVAVDAGRFGIATAGETSNADGSYDCTAEGDGYRVAEGN